MSCCCTTDLQPWAASGEWPGAGFSSDEGHAAGGRAPVSDRLIYESRWPAGTAGSGAIELHCFWLSTGRESQHHGRMGTAAPTTWPTFRILLNRSAIASCGKETQKLGRQLAAQLCYLLCLSDGSDTGPGSTQWRTAACSKVAQMYADMQCITGWPPSQAAVHAGTSMGERMAVPQASIQKHVQGTLWSASAASWPVKQA